MVKIEASSQRRVAQRKHQSRSIFTTLTKIRLWLDLDGFLGRLRHGAFLAEEIGRFRSASDSGAEIVHGVHGKLTEVLEALSKQVDGGCVEKLMGSSCSTQLQCFVSFTTTSFSFRLCFELSEVRVRARLKIPVTIKDT